MTDVVRLVLRDLVEAALLKQPSPVSSTQLAAMLAPFQCGDHRQIKRALCQLEASGLAVRERGQGPGPSSGRAPDAWRAST